MRKLFVLSLLVLATSALADNPPAAAPAIPAGSVAAAPGSTPAQPQQPGPMSMLLPFAAMFGVIYFLMIRPQQKKQREQQSMLGSLKHGDDVLTSSGILGKVTGITDKVVTVEIADDVRVKMLKSQITQVVKGNLKEIAQ